MNPLLTVKENGNVGIGTDTPTAKLHVNGDVTVANDLTVNGSDVRSIPQNSKTAAYTLVAGDAGKHISITTGGVTIPANGSVAFPIGTTIAIFNNSGSNQAIGITSDTLRLAGPADPC